MGNRLLLFVAVMAKLNERLTRSAACEKRMTAAEVLIVQNRSSRSESANFKMSEPHILRPVVGSHFGITLEKSK
jgi:hypothetical protein